MARAVKKKSTEEIKAIFSEEDLRTCIITALTSPTRQILEILAQDDDTNDERIIDMALSRAVYLSYMEGDIKRLDWLLNKIGLKEVGPKQDNVVDLTQLNNETLLKALSK